MPWCDAANKCICWYVLDVRLTPVERYQHSRNLSLQPYYTCSCSASLASANSCASNCFKASSTAFPICSVSFDIDILSWLLESLSWISSWRSDWIVLPCRNIRLGQRWLITQEIQDKIPFLILDNMYSIDAFNISNLCQLDGYIPCCFEVLDFQVIKVSFIRQASKQTIILRRISWVFILIFNCNVQHDVYIHFLHSIDRSWNIKFLVD